jgi:hypothetical protein
MIPRLGCVTHQLRGTTARLQIEPLIERPELGPAVAEEHVAAAKCIIWGKPGRANIWGR